MKRRKLNLIGSIVGTVFSALASVVLALALFTVLQLVGALSGNPAIMLASIMMIGMAAVSVVALIMNILSIIVSKNAETLKAKKGRVITAIVFNFICVALFLYYLLMSGFNMTYLFVVIGLTVASVLMIIDLAMLKKLPAEIKDVENQENV